jgi:hypothetical protein
MSEEREEVEIETPEQFDELASRYFPADDEPDDTPGDDPEEQVDEAETDDAPGEEVDDTPETEPEKPDLHELQAKELQRFQQLNATLEKQLADHEANPTPETQAKIEKTRSRLDDLIEQGDEVDPYKATRTLAEEGKAQKELLTQLQEAVQNTAGASSQQVAQLQRQMHRLQFQIANPDLGERYDELMRQAAEEVDKVFGAPPANASPAVAAMYEKADAAALARIVAEAKSKAEQADSQPATDTAPPPKKPVATQPIKTKSGASKRPAKTPEQREAEWIAKFEKLAQDD